MKTAIILINMFFVFYSFCTAQENNNKSDLDSVVKNCKNKNFTQALMDVNYLIKKDSTFAEAYYYRGCINKNIKNHREAINDFNMAIKLGFNKADVYLERQKQTNFFAKNISNKDSIYKIELADINKAIELDSLLVEAYIDRAFLFRDLNIKYNSNRATRDSVNQIALNDINKALTIDSSYAQAYWAKGVLIPILYINKLPDDSIYSMAINNLTKAIFYDSENAMYYRDRSNFKSQNGDKLGACEDLKKAVELGGESIAISKYDYDNLCK
ncbi:MAG TPA: hypothetical protein PKK00_01665 [Bacteroidales bacterium]|nr:hypothetical protein [Bacteroidales bacterium]HPS16162.1 hypothetical protein [Bacteroidales bacterium]